MNEMKPEDVMKALEICAKPIVTSKIARCKRCPYWERDCSKEFIPDALALFREKDAEIERLKAENVALENGLEISLHQQKQIEADTVRKMQERLKMHFATYVLGYKISLTEALKAVNQIAKAMLEGV